MAPSMCDLSIGEVLLHRDLMDAPAPVQGWDMCENGSVSTVFAVLVFMSFFVGTRLYNGESVIQILRRPFVNWQPPSLTFFFAFVGTWSFCLTFPMFVTRYTTGRWTGKFPLQQLLPDAMAQMMGCQPLMGGNTTYLQYPLGGSASGGGGCPFTKAQFELDDDSDIDTTQAFDYHPLTDWSFTPHAVLGILWDAVGTMQIVLVAAYPLWSHSTAGGTRSSFHKLFGYLSMLVFMLHMIFSGYILWADVVVSVTPFQNAFQHLSSNTSLPLCFVVLIACSTTMHSHDSAFFPMSFNRRPT